MWLKFSWEIARTGPVRQKHSSVGPAAIERAPGLNRPAHGPDALPAQIVEGLQQIAGPTGAQAGLDLLLETAQPMTLTGGGTAGRPSEETETMQQAFPDIGNRGLKSAPVTCRADSEDPPAMATTIPGQPERQRESIKPGGREAVAPQAPSALGATFHPGPLILTSQLKEALDGNVQGQYQGSALCEFHSPGSGVKGVCLTLYPILSTIWLDSDNGRHNSTKPSFLSRHREQNHHPFVSRFCKTTPGNCRERAVVILHEE